LEIILCKVEENERMMVWMNVIMLQCCTIKYLVKLIYAKKLFKKEKYTITIAQRNPLMSTCPVDRKQFCQSHVHKLMYTLVIYRSQVRKLT
jgi:hypothetical protein